MKNNLILGLTLAIFLSPTLAYAQTPVVDQSASIEQLTEQIREILLQQIAMLQKQLEQMVAQETIKLQQQEIAGAVTAINNRVNAVATGGTPETTNVYVGEVSCLQRPAGMYYSLPITIEGEWRGGRVQLFNQENKIIKNKHLHKSDGGNFLFSPNYRILGSNLTDLTGQKVKYKAEVFSELPSSRHGQVYDYTYLLDEMTGEITLPEC